MDTAIAAALFPKLRTAALLAATLAGCSRETSPAPAAPAPSPERAPATPEAAAEDLARRDPTAARARQILQPFKTELRSALMGAMKSGPSEAIEVCSRVAPELANEASVGAVRVGRASHRLRNPDNVAPAWVAAPLAEDAARNRGEPRVIDLEDGMKGYIEPIVMQPMCGVCHGQEIAPAVSATLAERYPNDRARGFRSGDFRGVYWVELPASGD